MIHQDNEQFFYEFLSEMSILINKSYNEKNWEALIESVVANLDSNQLPIFKHLIQSIQALKKKESFLNFSSRTLEIIQQINVEVSSLAPIEKILQLSGDRLRSISKADLVFISLLSSDQKKLRVYTQSGHTIGDYINFDQNVQIGISGIVASTKEIQMCSNISSEDIYNDDFIQLLHTQEKIESFIAAPLIVNNDFIGIIYSARKNSYISSDFLLSMMINYCSQTAVAIQNAKLYTNEQKLLSFHIELIDEILEKGHKGILEKLHTFTDNHLLLLDESGNVIEDILTDELRTTIQHAFGDYHQLITQISSMKQNANGHIMLHIPIELQVFPILLNEMIVAYLILPQHLDEKDFINLMAIEQTKSVLTLKLSQEQVSFEVENRLRQSYIYDLILGLEAEEDLLRRGRHLKFPFQNEHQLMTVTPSTSFLNTIDENGLNTILEKIRSTLELPLQKASLVHAQKLIILCPTQQTKEVATKIKIFSNKWIDEQHYSIGISNKVKAAKDFAKAFEESKKAATFAHEMSDDKIFYYHDLGIIGLLFENENPQSLIDFRDKYLSPLIAHEKKNNAELLPTLQSYLNHESVVQAAAVELHVHYNTVRYRLAKIEEITELSLSNPYHRLNIQIALAIYKLIKD